jgi:hypothetical protein
MHDPFEPPDLRAARRRRKLDCDGTPEIANRHSVYQRSVPVRPSNCTAFTE